MALGIDLRVAETTTRRKNQMAAMYVETPDIVRISANFVLKYVVTLPKETKTGHFWTKSLQNAQIGIVFCGERSKRKIRTL